jgi:hypothetical protein
MRTLVIGLLTRCNNMHNMQAILIRMAAFVVSLARKRVQA